MLIDQHGDREISNNYYQTKFQNYHQKDKFEERDREGTLESTVKLDRIISRGRRNRGYIERRHFPVSKHKLEEKCRWRKKDGQRNKIITWFHLTIQSLSSSLRSKSLSIVREFFFFFLISSERVLNFGSFQKVTTVFI